MPEERIVPREQLSPNRSYILIRKLVADYGLDEMMKRIMAKTAAFSGSRDLPSIISENNAGQYYPDYGYNHPLFTNKMRIYNIQGV